MEYTVAKEWAIGDFINLVNKMISEGYKPIGGVSRAGDYYIQAMIKESN